MQAIYHPSSFQRMVSRIILFLCHEHLLEMFIPGIQDIRKLSINCTTNVTGASPESRQMSRSRV